MDDFDFLKGQKNSMIDRCETTLSPDIVRLIIAVRQVLDIGHMAPEFDELDKAVEAFSERVPYENETETTIAETAEKYANDAGRKANART